MLKTKMVQIKEMQRNIDQLTMDRDAQTQEVERLNSEIKKNTVKHFVEKGKF